MKSLDISTRTILIFILIGLILSLGASILIAGSLSARVTEEIRNRDRETLFGALESGPLAIARLNSAALAQKELNVLLANSSFQERGIESVIITGGENGKFTFASWNHHGNAHANCLMRTDKSYRFEESLNPFNATAVTDVCLQPRESFLIDAYSRSAGIIQALLAVLILGIALWPVAVSIRRAEVFLSSRTIGHLQPFIPLLSVRNLLSKAMRTTALEKEVAISNLATQVAHDIRSPISVLNLVVGTLDEVPDEKVKLLKAAIVRINDVARNLLDQTKIVNVDSKGPAEKFLVIDLIDAAQTIVNEKCIALGPDSRICIEASLPIGLTMPIKSSNTDLYAVISNLLNNAIESLPAEGGTISVVLRKEFDHAFISVQDTGKGIPEHALIKLGERGYTFEKQDGNGLGIYHAKKTVESLGGLLTITTELGSGTLITLKLPLMAKELP